MHLACLNQNSMTEEIIQELRNFNANENICDANNKKPLDYLNKKDSNEGESSAEKKQAVSNTNTIMVITNENHFDSFMTSNKEEDNKSNVNSTINNNTIQTPTKMEEGNNNENDNNVYDYNNEPTIIINSNNKYNTNNTINSKSDSVNRRQYTFGREEDFYKFQNKNDNNNQSNNNKNINNNKKDLDINFNNINDENGKESNILLQRIINEGK